ncbi:alanine racemase [Aquirufa sp.]|jgi:D-serine deaminase-like pyridoxal phosphate-dependent protein|uniref:alanine racemase n=1 Tax=Aquirufa sp. TaxID=2676249 RepID=UPI0037BF8CC6
MIDYTNIESPGLLINPKIVQANIEWVFSQVGNNPARLRPHIKTHKTREVNQMLLAAGITKFKAATIAEAELLALDEAPDVLLSMQPTGTTLTRFLELKNKYPKTSFACLLDDNQTAHALNDVSINQRVYVDLNMGMNRTGIKPEDSVPLINLIEQLPNLNLVGLHAYDGHIRDINLEDRKKHIEQDFQSFYALLPQVRNNLELVVGGTPSFLVHHKNPNYVCSPGTFVFFDTGYAKLYPENSLKLAVQVIGRVISIPTNHTISMDVGHKSVAPENGIDNRLQFIDHPDWKLLSQSEEHGIVEVGDSSSIQIGDIIRMYPYHICPTVALHQYLQIGDGSVWKVAARDRKITV